MRAMAGTRRLAASAAASVLAGIHYYQSHAQSSCQSYPQGHREELMAKAAERIHRAERVVAFTGAGISAASGIPTYRDAFKADGLWDGLYGQLALLVFGTKIGFLFLPTAAWRHYCERLLLPISRAQPNAGHLSLAALCDFVITQNIDGLHQRSAEASGAPVRQRHVYELHGTCMTHRHSWTGCAVEVDTARLDPSSPPALFTRPDIVLFFEGMPAAFWHAASLISDLGKGDVLPCMLLMSAAANR